jgi:hypothetical protein
MNNILFIDLLYSDFGSYDDDFNSISLAFNSDNIRHLKINIQTNYFKKLFIIYINYFYVFRGYKFVFLSSRLTHLILFSPLFSLKKGYFIYHFIPKNRIFIHGFFLKILNIFYNIGVYSKSVNKDMERIFGLRSTVLPSRLIDISLSKKRLIKKINNNYYSIYIPKIKPGIRNYISINGVSDGASKIFTHDPDLYELFADKLVTLEKFLDAKGYQDIYENSLFIAINFDENYEVRASGMILDALKFGCIIITNDHPIAKSYGFPNFLFTKDKYFTFNDSTINDLLKTYDDFRFYDSINFIHSWKTFTSK